MNPDPHERLLRYLDGSLAPDERRDVERWLRGSPEARILLRDLAEQVVAVADLERIADHAGVTAPEPRAPAPVETVWLRPGNLLAAAALVAILLLALVVLRQSRPESPTPLARVTKITGAGRCFGSRHGVETLLTNGLALFPGDTLESRSCDAWVELTLHDGTTVSLSGHSTLRVLDSDDATRRFHLLHGNLWAAPASNAPAPPAPLAIFTPALAAETRNSQFDVHASPTELLFRVNAGQALLVPQTSPDSPAVLLPPGQQITADLRQSAPLTPVPQPEPIHFWASHLWRAPEVLLGRWLPPIDREPSRLAAEPLLWPIPDQEPILLHAVALAAWRSTDHPVLLRADSRLRFRGRTDRAQTVRFGFSTQRMRGVFSGKFEIDVPPETLGPAGQTWDHELVLSDFHPLHPHLAASPEGLEFTDVYALTLRVDAGLQLHHVELIPREAGGLLPRR